MKDDEKVEIEEYYENGEVQIIWANNILMFCTIRGKEILDNMRNPHVVQNP